MLNGSVLWAKHLRLGSIVLSLGAIAVMALTVKTTTPAEAKTPGSTYCYFGVCHRVKTIEETRALVGREQSIVASHYDDCRRDRHNPCGLTSSGERFRPDHPDNTASPIYPDGTTLLVWNPETQRALVVRVNNAGPYHKNRKLDLSRAAAKRLGFEGKGVAKVYVQVVKAPEPAEAKYSKHRTYARVPGDIGKYSSVEEAERGMAVAYALQASATSLLAPVTSSVFSTPGYKFLVGQAPQPHSHVQTRLAAVHSPKSGSSTILEPNDRYEGKELEAKTVGTGPIAELEAAAATTSATAKEPQRQGADVVASDPAKAQPVKRTSRIKKKARSTRKVKRKKKVASRKSQLRTKRTNLRGAKQVRTAAVRSKQPQRDNFHANSITESHRRHMRDASRS